MIKLTTPAVKGEITKIFGFTSAEKRLRKMRKLYSKREHMGSPGRGEYQPKASGKLAKRVGRLASEMSARETAMRTRSRQATAQMEESVKQKYSKYYEAQEKKELKRKQEQKNKEIKRLQSQYLALLDKAEQHFVLGEKSQAQDAKLKASQTAKTIIDLGGSLPTYRGISRFKRAGIRLARGRGLLLKMAQTELINKQLGQLKLDPIENMKKQIVTLMNKHDKDWYQGKYEDAVTAFDEAHKIYMDYLTWSGIEAKLPSLGPSLPNFPYQEAHKG